MAYSIRNINPDLLEKLMHLSGENTGAKAIEYACKQFVVLYEDKGRINQELAQERGKSFVALQKLDNLKRALSEVLK